jgi:hypothetical protein
MTFQFASIVLSAVFTLFIWIGAASAEFQSQFLPDGSLQPGTRITIPVGTVREFLFQPEGVRFLSGVARITSIGDPLVGPDGQEIREFVIDIMRSPGVPWIHHDKPFRLRIRAETDFTLEARKNWEWSPEDEHKPI